MFYAIPNTSEQKTSQIHAELKQRFKGLPIISVTGVRRQESRQRAGVKIADFNATNGIWSWRPIADWSEDEVFSSLEAWRIELHPAYRQFGMSRVSCRFCIMSSHADLVAATRQEETHDLYRRMVGLESRSTFAFQGNRWLADIAPHLLDRDMLAAIAQAKERAQLRMEAERRIARSMLYVKGWPTRMLSDAEADLLAGARTRITDMLALNSLYLDRTSIHQRYAELMEIRENRRRAA